jgi:hypothetical protein
MNAPTVTEVRKVFSLLCRVEVNIRAPAARVWSLLTNAGDFPRWNSTVTRIEGQIQDGASLRLKVPGIDRTVTVKVSGLVPNERMVWTGGSTLVIKGVRAFALTARGDGSTDFAMEERFSGLVFALVKRSLPDFGRVFERYAEDLRREAELSC